ncbi:uncharacterized protein IUM83_10072 [Phytophthora cinnamomi]|uniref:uncharacterized protein n=1 Tax=Phytophthora cinnamomi TaxID=4785 RepID=UPI0035594C6D|nr:hypothetical protein IUM83_10072 [Phytophthora cinnamomi]
MERTRRTKGLDEVQQAAIDEYLAKKEEKKKEKEGEEEEEEDEKDKKKSKASGQTVVQMGKATDAAKTKKKRKRADRPTLSNKKLLSFSMDDDSIGFLGIQHFCSKSRDEEDTPALNTLLQ